MPSADAPPHSPLATTQAATKIVATIGPASEGLLPEMIRAGLSVARINFSHGTLDDHARRIRAIRTASEEVGTAVGILADIQGPKLRLGSFTDGSRKLERGEELVLAERAAEGERGELPFDFAGFLEHVRAGDRVFMADGEVEAVIERVEGDRALARVKTGGVVSNRKGIHLPDTDLQYEVPTVADREHLAFACEQHLDFIGISFVSRGREVRRVRELAPGMKMIAKIERLAALENLRAILEAADGVMVARGDLGVECPLEELPLIQKRILAEALLAGKMSITATEMLESMVHSSRPTRAEVTDVANAVFDGTDAVMLSAETAVGENPVQSVRAMTIIARAVEVSDVYQRQDRVAFRESEPTFSNATAMAAAHAAEALDIKRIVCFTESGNTVRLLSRYRAGAEIIALTPTVETLRSMTLLAGVRPMLFPRAPTLEEMLREAQVGLVERGVVLPGEEVVFVAGVPPGVSRSTNVMKLHRIGEATTLH